VWIYLAGHHGIPYARIGGDREDRARAIARLRNEHVGEWRAHPPTFRCFRVAATVALLAVIGGLATVVGERLRGARQVERVPVVIEGD